MHVSNDLYNHRPVPPLTVPWNSVLRLYIIKVLFDIFWAQSQSETELLKYEYYTVFLVTIDKLLILFN